MSPRVRYPEANAAIWRPLNLDTRGSIAPARPARHRPLSGCHAPINSRRASAGSQRLSKRPSFSRSRKHSKRCALLQERFARQDSRGLWLMFGAVTLVLLVGCVNVSNLLLARASRPARRVSAAKRARRQSRPPAAALRWPSRSSLQPQAACSAVAVALALLVCAPADPAAAIDVSDAPRRRKSTCACLAFALVIALVTCVLAGLMPAIRVSRTDPLDAIKQQAQAR